LGFAGDSADTDDDKGAEGERGPLGRRFNTVRGFGSRGDDDGGFNGVCAGDESPSDEVDWCVVGACVLGVTTDGSGGISCTTSPSK
jgi:hypothetical protein